MEFLHNFNRNNQKDYNEGLVNKSSVPTGLKSFLSLKSIQTNKTKSVLHKNLADAPVPYFNVAPSIKMKTMTTYDKMTGINNNNKSQNVISTNRPMNSNSGSSYKERHPFKTSIEKLCMEY